MKVLNDYIIVEQIKKKELPSGLIVPDADDDPHQEGVIRGVGVDIEDLELRKGRKILFNRAGGWEFEHNGKKLLWIRYEQALAVFIN